MKGEDNDGFEFSNTQAVTNNNTSQVRILSWVAGLTGIGKTPGKAGFPSQYIYYCIINPFIIILHYYQY